MAQKTRVARLNEIAEAIMHAEQIVARTVEHGDTPAARAMLHEGLRDTTENLAEFAMECLSARSLYQSQPSVANGIVAAGEAMLPIVEALRDTVLPALVLQERLSDPLRVALAHLAGELREVSFERIVRARVQPPKLVTQELMEVNGDTARVLSQLNTDAIASLLEEAMPQESAKCSSCNHARTDHRAEDSDDPQAPCVYCLCEDFV